MIGDVFFEYFKFDLLKFIVYPSLIKCTKLSVHMNHSVYVYILINKFKKKTSKITKMCG